MSKYEILKLVHEVEVVGVAISFRTLQSNNAIVTIHKTVNYICTVNIS